MNMRLSTVTIEQLHDYRFAVSFENTDGLFTDEPAPIGGGTGPSPGELLATAVGNCLASSLFFCLKKHNAAAGPIKATIDGRLERNPRGHRRIAAISVNLEIASSDAVCFETFENYCIVTQSVRDGIPVSIQVRDPHGNLLFENQ